MLRVWQRVPMFFKNNIISRFKTYANPFINQHQPIQNTKNYPNKQTNKLQIKILNLNLDKLNQILNQLKKQIQPMKKQIKQNLPQMNQKNIKYLYYIFCFLMVSYGIYLFKKQQGKQVSQDQIINFIINSQVDCLYLTYFSQKQIKESSLPKFLTMPIKYVKVVGTLNGQKFYSILHNIKDFMEKVQEIQQKKIHKTKIIQNQKQSFEKQLQRFFIIVAKIITPMIFPYLLFTSSIGKIFQSKVLGKLDGIRPNVRFSHVAGLGDSKVQVSQLVDFLKNPQKYKKIGARIPKGALLVGPPGTGKTMLAKACAGQAQVPFFSVSGSQFVELYAGMGAYRVRELFKNAKKQTPAIIFIDQIDAIGRKREDKFGGSSDQRANTLNQLLVQMDGFGTSEDIIVLAATNRKQILDPALTRPGRFDRMIEIDLPDIKGRQQILQIYLKKLQLSPQQQFSDYSKRIATLTFGFSGADLANLCNQAAILAVREQKKYVSPMHFQQASDRILAGLKNSLNLDEMEKKRVAYHECGHAVTAWFLQGASPLLKITIIPRSKGSLGFAQYLPNQATLLTKDQLLDQLCVILGGRSSQQFFFKQITNGASDDLSKARKLAKGLIVTYGMGKKNPNYAPVQTQGHNIYSEQTSAQIDEQIKELIKQSTVRCRKLIQQHEQKIKLLAEQVLKKETLNHKEIKQILGERPFLIRQNYREYLNQTQKATTNFSIL